MALEGLSVLCLWVVTGQGLSVEEQTCLQSSQGGRQRSSLLKYLLPEQQFVAILELLASGLFYGALCSWNHTQDFPVPLLAVVPYGGHLNRLSNGKWWGGDEGGSGAR